MSVRECYSREHLQRVPVDFKRLFDVLFSLVFILLALPLCLVIASLIKLTSRGPLFYGSRRAGKHGVSFTCWKFRTMCPNAEEKLKECLNKDPELTKEWDTFLKLKKDPRVTLLGRLLRKTSLDELPQLWNVLRGDLSLVGPRPYLVSEMRDLVGMRAGTILSIRPGITGLWQVSGRNNIPFSDRMRLDEEYVSKRSFVLDLRLLFKTIPTVFLARGN